MKLLILFLLLLNYSNSTFSQPPDSTILSIHVYDMHSCTPLTNGFEVQLFSKQKVIFRKEIFNSNQCNLKIKKDTVNTAVNIVINKINFSKNNDVCGNFIFSEFPYLQYDSIIHLQLTDTINVFVYLEKLLVELKSPPSFLFKKNVSNCCYTSDSSWPVDSVLKYIACNCIQNNVKVEIISHTDSHEKNQTKLSAARAEYIKKQLIKLGVPESQIQLKLMNNTSPLYSPNQVNKIKSNREKKLKHNYNSRITFRFAK